VASDEIGAGRIRKSRSDKTSEVLRQIQHIPPGRGRINLPAGVDGRVELVSPLGMAGGVAVVDCVDELLLNILRHG